MMLGAGCGSSGTDGTTATSREGAAGNPTSVYPVVTDQWPALYPDNQGSGQLFACDPIGAAPCTRIPAAGNQVALVAVVGTRVMVGSNDGSVHDCPGRRDVDAGGNCRTPIAPVDSVRAMASPPDGYLVLGRNMHLKRCVVREGRGPVCTELATGVGAPVSVSGDTVYVVGGARGNEIRSCSLSDASKGCETVVGTVPPANAGFLAVTGIAPLNEGLVVTSRDEGGNPLVHACRASAGCVKIQGLGDDAHSALSATASGGAAYVGGRAGDGYIEGPGYVARCSLDACTRLPLESDGREPWLEGGIITALAGAGTGFIAGGVAEPVVWACTAGGECSRPGPITGAGNNVGIGQLASGA
ncbi:MAG: hypothetical protein FJW92_03465 [Actinobacteria bacterium]|nr:hypothetical protein [Actinomycetota bacterium]